MQKLSENTPTPGRPGIRKTVSKYQGVKTKKSFVSPVNFSRVEIKFTSESLDLVNYLFLLMINF